MYDKASVILVGDTFPYCSTQYLIPDTSDTGLESELSRTTLTDRSSSALELTKLQEKQRAAVARVQRSNSRATTGGSNLHPDLRDLDFNTLGSDASGLPSPLRPTSPDSPSDRLPGRGSLSDYSDYDSLDEDTHDHNVHSSGSGSPGSGKRKSQGNYRTFGDQETIGRQTLLDDSDPFADPEVSTPGTVGKQGTHWS